MDLKELTEVFETLIVAWLKSGDENATNLAHSLAKYAKSKQCNLTDVVESSDVLVVKFSDDEIKLMTTKEFEDYENDCIEFDGFIGCIVLGKLTKSS